MRLILIAAFASMTLSVMSGPFDNLPTAVRGTSGRTYEIVGRIAEVHPDMSPVFYVVKFRADDLDDVPSLRKMAEDIRPTLQAEAERAHFDWLVLLAVKQTGIGTFAYERRYGFTFNRDTTGTWRDATNLTRLERK
jgi:hypothetical protein